MPDATRPPHGERSTLPASAGWPPERSLSGHRPFPLENLQDLDSPHAKGAIALTEQLLAYAETNPPALRSKLKAIDRWTRQLDEHLASGEGSLAPAVQKPATVVLEPLPEELPRQTFADGEFNPLTYAYETKEV